MSTQTVERRRSFTFGVVFILLAIFTALEIARGYLPALPRGIKVALLIFFAVVKVGLVLLHFMHLKFDSHVFALPFALGRVNEEAIMIMTVTEDIPPANSRNLALNLGAGHYVMICKGFESILR
jgi:caa(3)-type oxidase subunit IV